MSRLFFILLYFDFDLDCLVAALVIRAAFCGNGNFDRISLAFL